MMSTVYIYSTPGLATKIEYESSRVVRRTVRKNVSRPETIKGSHNTLYASHRFNSNKPFALTASRMEPSDRNSSRPFDERDDEMSVRKGLLFFSQDKAAEAVQVLSRESSLSRSSLLSLNVPFVEDIDDADDDDNVTYRVKDNIRIQDGCYLLYDAASGGTLVLHYSHERVPENAVGFWTPAPNAKLQEFKFRRAGGYTELVRGIIGGEKNKRQYLSGWCQFVQMAKR